MVRTALVVGCLAIGAVAGAAPHAGRVVRVDRAPGKPAGTPRLCNVSESDLSATCIGKKPELGDRITVVNTHRTLAVLQVDSVMPLQQCLATTTWSVQTRLESGDLASSASDPLTVGMIDVAVSSSNAHLLKLDHAPGDRKGALDTAFALDSNGDGAPELAFAIEPCDDAGMPSTAPTGSCIEVWYMVARRFELLRTDRIPASCN